MDVHMKANSHLQFRTNETTAHNSDNGDELKFLSQEEQDILHFFERTIDSLEQSLEEEELRPQLNSLNSSADVADAASFSRPHLQANPKDIIDLVRPPRPDLVETRETTHTFNTPDFQSLIHHPESHFEIKPRNEPTDPLPDYVPTITDNTPLYHPPGSIPTPVLIAQKIAENQASGGGSGGSVLSASSLLRRRSSEFDKSTSSNKQGPPTSTKPARYPSNISVILGNREQPNPSLANVNLEERRALVLANLSGTSHPFVQEEGPNQDQKERNTPTRSVSFRDPTPEKSRAEALSKLGLTRNRALSGGVTLPSPAQLLAGGDATDLTNPSLPEPSATKLTEPSIHNNTSEQLSVPPYSVSSKPEIVSTPKVISISTPQEQSIPSSVNLASPTSPAMLPSSSKAQETKPRSPVVHHKKTEIPSPDMHKSLPHSSYTQPPSSSQKDYFPFPPAAAPPPVEVTPEFNSYGGKSIVVNPSAPFKAESPSSPLSPGSKNLPPIVATPSEFNSYGGKSKVMCPVPVPAARRDLPDILSSHIDKSQTPPQTQSSSESDSKGYGGGGGRTRTVRPTGSAVGPSGATLKPPAPLPAPKPARHSLQQGPPAVSPKSPLRSLSPEQKRRSSLFRPLGITVHFSGKGATDESRREALRKLGLWKE